MAICCWWMFFCSVTYLPLPISFLIKLKILFWKQQTARRRHFVESCPSFSPWFLAAKTCFDRAVPILLSSTGPISWFWAAFPSAHGWQLSKTKSKRIKGLKMYLDCEVPSPPYSWAHCPVVLQLPFNEPWDKFKIQRFNRIKTVWPSTAQWPSALGPLKWVITDSSTLPFILFASKYFG